MFLSDNFSAVSCLFVLLLVASDTVLRQRTNEFVLMVSLYLNLELVFLLLIYVNGQSEFNTCERLDLVNFHLVTL